MPTVEFATPIAIAVIEYEGRLLIGLRPVGKPLAGFWEFPGGKVRPGESPAAAAIRECREETGLSVEVVGLLDEFVYAYQHGDLHLHFFQCRLQTATSLPLPPFEWMPRERLSEFEFPPANRTVVEKLISGVIRDKNHGE